MLMKRTPGTPAESLNASVTALEGQGYLRLKSLSCVAAGQLRAVSLAGLEMPRDVGQGVAFEAAGGRGRILCVGPLDWFMVMEDLSAVQALLDQLKPYARDEGLIIVDLSHSHATFEVQGPAACELLAKGCGLDFHERVFTAGRCARTRLAQMPVLIERRDNQGHFELHAPRSYAQYLLEWLADAAIGLTELS